MAEDKIEIDGTPDNNHLIRHFALGVASQLPSLTTNLCYIGTSVRHSCREPKNTPSAVKPTLIGCW